MAITNLYPNLPGHLVEFKDGGLQYVVEADEAKSHKSLLILGTAFDGPINEPVKIDKTTVSQVFGPDVNDAGYPNGATLVKYAKQAFKNGFGDVRCMRVTGTPASVDVVKATKTITTEMSAKGSQVIPGNEETKHNMAHKPVTVPKVTNVTTGMPITIGGVEYDATSPSDHIYKIQKDTLNAGTSLELEYRYSNPQTSGPSTEALSDDLAATGFITATVALPTGFTTDDITVDMNGTGANTTVIDKGDWDIQFGGVSIKAEPSVTAAVNAAGTDLEISIDYASLNATLAGLGATGTLAADGTDSIEVSFSWDPVPTVTGEGFNVDDADTVITLDHTPNAGTFEVVVNGTDVAADPAKYTVVGDQLTIKAGAFYMNDVFYYAYKYDDITTVDEGITVKSIYGGSDYNNAKVKVETYTNAVGESHVRFIFTKPDDKVMSAADIPFMLNSEDCPTVADLRDALANYVYNNVFEIVCDDEDMITSDFVDFESNLSGGTDGVKPTNNEMFEALSGKRNAAGYLIELGAYQILENYNVDYIYPAGVYADMSQTVNKNSDFHHELALACAVYTYRTKMTHGFIDVKPNSNTTLKGVQKYVEDLMKYNNIHYMRDEDGNDIVDENGDKMDIGWYTSVVVGPEPVIQSDTLGKHYGSPAIAYAALCGSLQPQSAPTNKALLGVLGMKFKFSNKQMNELVGNRYVIFKLKNEGVDVAGSSTPYVVDSCTGGNPDCDYKRITTVQVVTDVVDQVREVADPFIGEPNTIEQRNALSALIAKRLGHLLETGEIQYYDFEINATVQQVLLGECTIALTLVVPQELRKITTVVALRASA